MALKPDIPYIRDTQSSVYGATTGSKLEYISTSGGTADWSDEIINQCFSLRFNSVYSPYYAMCRSRKPQQTPTLELSQIFDTKTTGSPGMMICRIFSDFNTAAAATNGNAYGFTYNHVNGRTSWLSRVAPPDAALVTGDFDLSHYFLYPTITAQNNEMTQTFTGDWKTYKETALTSYPIITSIAYRILYKADIASSNQAAYTNLYIVGGYFDDTDVPTAYTGSGLDTKVYISYTGIRQISTGGYLYYPPQIVYNPIYVNPATLPSYRGYGGTTGTHSPSIQFIHRPDPNNYSRAYVCINASTAEKIIQSCGMWVAYSLSATADAKGVYTTSNDIFMPEINSEGVPTGNGWTGGGVSDPTQSPIYQHWNQQQQNFPTGGEDAVGAVTIDVNIPPSKEADSDNKPLDEETEELEPAAPEINGLGVFANYFAMSASSVLSLSDFLWNADETTIDDIINSLKLFGANPVNAIMSLRLYPFDVGTMAGSLDAEKIILGRVDTDVYGLKLTNNANAIIDLGKLYIAAHFGDFRDYSPYSAYNLYIPFIGTVSLNPNDYLNRMISIKMIIDITTGKATAIIYANGIPMQYLDGMIAIEIPITSENMGQTANAIIGAVGSTAGALVTGNIVGAAMTAAAGAADVLFNDVSINKTGNVSASTSFFSPINAYVVISRPNAVIPSNYGHSRGYSCDYSAALSSVAGYTICVNVDTSGISGATDAERTQIKNLLEGGVYL